jgi:hypothetical protein
LRSPVPNKQPVVPHNHIHAHTHPRARHILSTSSTRLPPNEHAPSLSSSSMMGFNLLRSTPQRRFGLPVCSPARRRVSAVLAVSVHGTAVQAIYCPNLLPRHDPLSLSLPSLVLTLLFLSLPPSSLFSLFPLFSFEKGLAAPNASTERCERARHAMRFGV